MKFIKNWKVFEAEEKEITSDDISAVEPNSDLDKSTEQTHKDALSKIQKSLQDFRQKQQMVNDIFKKNLNDVDLRKELMDSVYKNNKQDQGRNRYIQEYENILRLTRRVGKTKKSISDDKSRKIDIQQNIYSLKDDLLEVTNPGDKTDILDKIKKNQNYLKKIDFNINKNMKELNLDQTNYDKRKSNFETQMKEEEKRIQNLIK
jgi:hypothetical protein